MTTLGSYGPLREGLLLDADYVTLQGRAAVRLWVKSQGKAFPLLDPGFEPYFYALPVAEEADMEGLARKLMEPLGSPRPRRVEPLEARDGLRKVRALRVVAHHPQDVPRLRELVARVEGVKEHREADIPFAFRYLIDRRLRPMGGVAFAAKPSQALPGALELEHAEAREAPGIEGEARVLAFDLEVYNPKVVPRPREDPIVLVAVATSTGRLEVLENPGRSPEDCRGRERELLQRFLALLREEDPDVLVTYNGDEFDWPYLLERARLHRLRVDVGRDGSEPQSRSAGLHRAVSVVGRANIDLLRVAERDLGEVKVKTLKNVADFLGVVEVQDRVMLRKDRIHAMWDSPAERPRLVAYARDDARSTLELAQRLLPLQAEFARMTRTPLDEASKMGRGRQVDWFLLAEAHVRGLLAPNKAFVREDMYEGGIVLEPPQGLHEDVVALDFSSMYPSLMVRYNVSPETFLPPEIAGAFKPEEVSLAPEVGHRFVREPQGFFPSILQELVAKRRAWKERLKQENPGSAEHRLADVKQQALKVLTNAFYGYTGWAGARWYKRECAEATTAWGRDLIKRVVEEARAQGLEVLYGDTDSCFVRASPRIQDFVEHANARYPVELDVQNHFEVIFFTGAKKRYAGLTRDGKVVIRGLEVRRGDWCELAKDLQEQVLELVLRRRDPQAALQAAKDAVKRVRDGQAGLEALTIFKTLTMEPEEYKAKQAHVHAVERARRQQPDYKPPLGAKIGYVILRAKGPLKDKLPTERAVLVDFLQPADELDLDYYVDKQLVPAALRVLEFFGHTESDVKGAPRQQSLKDWF